MGDFVSLSLSLWVMDDRVIFIAIFIVIVILISSGVRALPDLAFGTPAAPVFPASLFHTECTEFLFN
jgi:hypothetical protein